ncbi:MAG TPA: redoxin domain-containing protein [Bacteroidia bacterium]|nr:redoxin domain-containing protein [Bacteroidia bacterium]
MSSTKPVFTWLGIFFTLAGAVVLLVFNQPEFAALIAMIGYLVAMKDFSKFTSPLQSFTEFGAAAVTGLSLDFPLEHFPFYTVMMLTMLFANFGRIMFFKYFAYTGKSWMEPTFVFIALSMHLAGNMLSHSSWATWFVPVPGFFFAFLIAWGIIKDKKQLSSHTLKGYKIAIGAYAPPFELPDQQGNAVKLSDFIGNRHLLLIFVRGDWCPGCHMMLRTYQKEKEIFARKNVYVMSIGPDPVGVNKEMVERLGLEFSVLADDKQRTAMTYGVQLEEYDNQFAEQYDEGIPLPASFLIDKEGIVRYISRPDKVGEFLNPSLIFPIVEQLD